MVKIIPRELGLIAIGFRGCALISFLAFLAAFFPVPLSVASKGEQNLVAVAAMGLCIFLIALAEGISKLKKWALWLGLMFSFCTIFYFCMITDFFNPLALVITLPVISIFGYIIFQLYRVQSYF